jgi:hypothetical protein
MTFAPRLRAARILAALVAAVALAVPAAALASTSTITQSDCAQGTIRDKSGQSISQGRCQQLIGKNVQLAGTGFEVWPLVAAGAACLAGAAALGLRRRSPVSPT